MKRFTLFYLLYSFREERFMEVFTDIMAENLLDAINSITEDYCPMNDYAVPDCVLHRFISFEEHA